MFSYLIVALFAVLSLSVSSRPVQRDIDPCDEPTTTPTPTVSPSPTPTDDCYEPSSIPPTSLPPSTSSPSSVPPSTYIPPTSSSPTSPSPTSPSPTPVAVAPTPASVSVDASSGPFTGGVATYFYQDGNPGACGQVNSDSALICAMDQARFGTSGPSSSLCGQRVQITNTNNGKSVTVTIADDCPTCQNENSIDLSVAAFQALENDLSVGEFPISWVFA